MVSEVAFPSTIFPWPDGHAVWLMHGVWSTWALNVPGHPTQFSHAVSEVGVPVPAWTPWPWPQRVHSAHDDAPASAL